MNSKRKLHLSFKLKHPNLYIIHRYIRYKVKHIDKKKLVDTLMDILFTVTMILWVMFMLYWGFFRT